MCNKRNSRTANILKVTEKQGIKIGEIIKTIKVDSCIVNLIHVLNCHGFDTLACCCGHGKYDMSIIHKSPNGKVWDLISGIEIPRKRNFYKKDKEGFYYIPETITQKVGYANK